jgi:hypothetical protein
VTAVLGLVVLALIVFLISLKWDPADTSDLTPTSDEVVQICETYGYQSWSCTNAFERAGIRSP